jgi:hypothetical protein
MIKLQFIGHVFPSVALVAVSIPPVIRRWTEENLDLLFRIGIISSIINVKCDLPNWKSDDLAEIYKRSLSLARSAVNIVAFSTGFGLGVSLDTLIGPDGMPSALLPSDPTIPPLCKSYGLGPERQANFAKVCALALTDHRLASACNDLMESITIPHIACVNCGRAIDNISRMITPGQNVTAASWKAMQTALNISRAYQEWISEQAKGSRHADHSFIPGHIVEEVAHEIWMIMDRFLEYRKVNNTPLAPPMFPFL